MGKCGDGGSANVGVPQGSPLSPVAFLIWMAPILQKMEERVNAGTGLDVQMPSFVDGMCTDIVDWEGGRNMQWRRISKGSCGRWLGVIFDDSLDFDIQWKSRIAKASKALGVGSFERSGWIAMGDVPRGGGGKRPMKG